MGCHIKGTGAESLHSEGKEERTEGGEGDSSLDIHGGWVSGEDGVGRCKGSQSRRLPGEFQGQQEAVRSEQSLGESAEELRAAGPGHAGSVHRSMNAERMQATGGLRGRHALCRCGF